MNYKDRFLELLSLVQRFLKHQATIGELRGTVRKMEAELKNNE